jgi:hypothetical protein
MGVLLALFPGRLWGYVAVAAVIFGLGGTVAWKVQGWRITNIKAEHTEALADAKERVNQAEQANLKRVQEAQNANTKLRQTNAANSVVARTELERLRSALDFRSYENTLEACIQRANTRGQLLAQCGEEITDLARRADGHVADLKMIADAWPE